MADGRRLLATDTGAVSPSGVQREGVPTEPAREMRGKAAAAVTAGGSSGSPVAAEGEEVESLMKRLRLTATESKAVVLDDDDDLELIDPEKTMVGKVLAPNVLHINTISAALRPAWGNPRGLFINPQGENMFIAEFASKQDRDRVMDGSPWMVGRNAVLLKKYDANIPPSEVNFDRLALWARILALPYRLMNATRGFEIAEPIGLVRKVDADALGRCWGGYMRLRVEVAVQEPLVRFVTVFSKKFQSTERYDVQYEKLPIYCFSCGLVGHTALVCSHSAVRDENDQLPYSSKRLLVPDDSKRSGSKSEPKASSTGGGQLVPESRGSSGGSSVPGGTRLRGKEPGSSSHHVEEEVPTPLNGGGRGRGRAGCGRGRGRTEGSGKGLFQAKPVRQTAAGQKRKPTKDQQAKQLLFEAPTEPVDSHALVVLGAAQEHTIVDDDTVSSDSCKKQKTTPPRSADQAETAAQSRQTQ